MRDNDIILARVGDTYKFEKQFKAANEVYKQVVNLYPGTDGALSGSPITLVMPE